MAYALQKLFIYNYDDIVSPLIVWQSFNYLWLTLFSLFSPLCPVSHERTSLIGKGSDIAPTSSNYKL